MEIDHLLSVTDGDLDTYDDDQVYEMINWWLATPVGERWGDPGWGNSLVNYKHDPTSTSTLVAIEGHIFSKMGADLDTVNILDVYATFDEIDLVYLEIQTDKGTISTSYDRANS